MRLSSKHANESATMLQSFVGGLNTSSPDELIAENQLAQCVNMEINGVGQLRTVKGTTDVAVSTLTLDYFVSGAYDSINDILLTFSAEGTIYALLDGTFKEVGTLSGNDEVSTIPWEDGLLIASGGHLQYAKYQKKKTITTADNDTDEEYTVVTITSSPADCGGVAVRSGRVFVFDSEDNLRFSGVGTEGLKDDGSQDDAAWAEDSNDPSTALFTQIGYKVGGRIIGMINFQSYVLIIKDNGKIYRLENEYPDWTLKEVTSNGLCKGKAAYASIGQGVFVLGAKTLQAISPTDDNGNMPINYVGKQIEHEIANLPPSTKMRYNTELNQLWFVTNSEWVLVYDCNTQTFFERYFNSDVVDIVGNYIIKRKKVCLLNDDDTLKDDGIALEYLAKFKTERALNDILVKSVALSFKPLVSFYEPAGANLKVGRINVSFPKRIASTDGTRAVTVGVGNTATEPKIKDVINNTDQLYLNDTLVSPGQSILYKKKQVCRCDMVEVELHGSGFPFILNYISYNKVVV